MPTTNDLCAIAAEVFELDAQAVKQRFRCLREAGLLPDGQRGRKGGPADITPEHAASVLIGLMAGDTGPGAAGGALVLGNLSAQCVAVYRSVNGIMVGQLTSIADARSTPQHQPVVNRLTKSLRSAMAEAFRDVAEADETDIESVTVAQDWQRAPYAIVEAYLPACRMFPDGASIEISYAPDASELNTRFAIERAPKARAGVIHAFGSLFAEPSATRQASFRATYAPIGDTRCREYSVLQAL